MGIPPKEPPTHIQTHSVSQTQSMTLRLTQRLNPSQNFLGQHRRFLRGFTGRVNLCKRIRLYRILIRWRSTTMLSERHTRIFWSECSHRLILLRHMPSFVPVAQHLLREKVIIFDTTMERTFLWQYSSVSFSEEHFNMPFSISDGSVKSVSVFEDRHDFYFTSKTLFVFKVFKFFSSLFGHVSKRLDQKDKGNFTFSDLTAWLTNNGNVHIVQYREK